MSEVIQLWHVPKLAKSFEKEHAGKQLIELINRETWVVVWHIDNHKWLLSEDAQRDLKAKLKKGSKGYSSGHHRKIGRLF